MSVSQLVLVRGCMAVLMVLMVAHLMGATSRADEVFKHHRGATVRWSMRLAPCSI